MAIEIEHGNPATEEQVDRERLSPPPMYRVVLLNDDFTPMDFVTDLLKWLFHKSSAEAERIMLTIHKQGRGVCGIYPFDVAETKQYQSLSSSRQHGHPLRCIIEEDG
ncbi:MAG: ATP-dependent Clp protease adapter ClpS [Mariprofundales bacterium]|nr:ATP-dependent Clp protease adapter ClpS [Mariprofundales bacterium]